MAAAEESDVSMERVVSEQVRVHYGQVPAMAIAPSLGALFTAWVLWDAVPNQLLVAGVSLVGLLAVARLIVYWRYRRVDAARAADRRWRVYAVVAAFLSGSVWGSAAPLLYPPLLPGYEVFLIVLLTMVPIVPVAALASYMPSFYAYYVPCITPFVVSLALQGSRPEVLTAILLVMMMGAMVTFARHHSQCLAEAVKLRLELAEKTEALERTITQKSQFIAAASHDLRQPVHSIGLFLESLRHETRARKDMPWIEHIGASLASLRNMLTNMLDISKLDAAAVTPRPSDFSAAGLIGRLRDEFAPLATLRGIDLRCRGCRASDVMVRSDPALLERVLRNLLSNAVKYTMRGGVLLACRQRGPLMSIEVWDTGVGMQQEHLGSIFREFTHFDHGERAGDTGLGLGLAIAKRLCDLLGHAIHVRSRYGRGTVFRVVVARGAGKPAEQPATAYATPDLTGTWILVVDDDEGVRAGASALLQQWGCNVIVADTSAAALARIGEVGVTPEVLLVDYQFANGERAPDTIAQLQRVIGRPVPAIVITGNTAAQPVREVYAAGHMLLHKPVDPDRLRACIVSLREMAA